MKLGFNIEDRKVGDVFMVLPDYPSGWMQRCVFTARNINEKGAEGWFGDDLGSGWVTVEWKYLGYIGTTKVEDWAEERLKEEKYKALLKAAKAVVDGSFDEDGFPRRPAFAIDRLSAALAAYEAQQKGGEGK